MKAEPAQLESSSESFERIVLPHFEVARNLARWLARTSHDADDIVQEAYLRALRFFDTYQGGDARAWVLRIVRNTSHSHRKKHGPVEWVELFDETIHRDERSGGVSTMAPTQSAQRRLLREALEELPVESRELLFLRELEGHSYREIAEMKAAPIGTVMSRLARARKQLRAALDAGPKTAGGRRRPAIFLATANPGQDSVRIRSQRHRERLW